MFHMLHTFLVCLLYEKIYQVFNGTTNLLFNYSTKPTNYVLKTFLKTFF
ncbi:hypothetical protein A0H76_3053 [Hepatospora eriocheir]|uniref:Uncharacterized protein n=1 Tax=Hepatospora eriocheir TaxID=1081669 RepID=A0A1X0QEH9_9MICR|nr:hypothetical protein A0H76_3053 [Hepatospora eriocheir]